MEEFRTQVFEVFPFKAFSNWSVSTEGIHIKYTSVSPLPHILQWERGERVKGGRGRGGLRQ
jgi:hypothetical protein